MKIHQGSDTPRIITTVVPFVLWCTYRTFTECAAISRSWNDKLSLIRDRSAPHLSFRPPFDSAAQLGAGAHNGTNTAPAPQGTATIRPSARRNDSVEGLVFTKYVSGGSNHAKITPLASDSSALQHTYASAQMQPNGDQRAAADDYPDFQHHSDRFRSHQPAHPGGLPPPVRPLQNLADTRGPQLLGLRRQVAPLSQQHRSSSGLVRGGDPLPTPSPIAIIRDAASLASKLAPNTDMPTAYVRSKRYKTPTYPKGDTAKVLCHHASPALDECTMGLERSKSLKGCPSIPSYLERNPSRPTAPLPTRKQVPSVQPGSSTLSKNRPSYTSLRSVSATGSSDGSTHRVRTPGGSTTVSAPCAPLRFLHTDASSKSLSEGCCTSHKLPTSPRQRMTQRMTGSRRPAPRTAATAGTLPKQQSTRMLGRAGKTQQLWDPATASDSTSDSEKRKMATKSSLETARSRGSVSYEQRWKKELRKKKITVSAKSSISAGVESCTPVSREWLSHL